MKRQHENNVPIKTHHSISNQSITEFRPSGYSCQSYGCGKTYIHCVTCAIKLTIKIIPKNEAKALKPSRLILGLFVIKLIAVNDP